MKNIYKIFTALLIFTLLPITAHAIEFIGGSSDKAITLSDSKEYNELIFAGGQTVNLEGKINDGAVVAAETLNINGQVDNHIFALAKTLTVNNTIKGNLIVAGDKIVIASGAIIEGDVLVLAGSSVVVEGKITGSIILKATQKLAVSGEITGNVDLGKIYSFTAFGDAIIGGNIFGSATSYNIANSATVNGENQITLRSEHSNSDNMSVATKILISFVSILLVVMLIQKTFPQYLNRTREIAFNDPLKSIGWGISMLVLMPIVIFAMFALIAPYLAGIIVFLAWIIFILLGIVFSHIWIGDALSGKKFSPLLATLIGSITLFALGIFPLLKIVVGFLIFLLGFGAVGKSFMSFRQTKAK